MRFHPFLSLFFGSLLLSSCTENPSSTSPDTGQSSPPVEEAISDQQTPSAEVFAVDLPTTQRQESGKLHPVDEGQLSPDFVRFRREL